VGCKRDVGSGTRPVKTQLLKKKKKKKILFDPVPGWEKSNPGSWINIPDPIHCLELEVSIFVKIFDFYFVTRSLNPE
jgi:hypothetical protein